MPTNPDFGHDDEVTATAELEPHARYWEDLGEVTVAEPSPFQTVVELDPDQAKALGFVRDVTEQPQLYIVEVSYNGESWRPQLVAQPKVVQLLTENYQRLANYGDGYEIKVFAYEGDGRSRPLHIEPIAFAEQVNEGVQYTYGLFNPHMNTDPLFVFKVVV